MEVESQDVEELDENLNIGIAVSNTMRRSRSDGTERQFGLLR